MGSSGDLTQWGHGDTQESSKSKTCWVEGFLALHTAADPQPSWFHSLGFLTRCLLLLFGSSSMCQGKQGRRGDPMQLGAGKAAPLLTSRTKCAWLEQATAKA